MAALYTDHHAGGKITRDAGPVKGAHRHHVSMRYRVSQVARPSSRLQRTPPATSGSSLSDRERSKNLFARHVVAEPVTCSSDTTQVMLRVSDLEKSIAYYRDCLGMKLLRTRDNPGARHD